MNTLKVKQIHSGGGDNYRKILSPNSQGGVIIKDVRDLTGVDIFKGTTFPTGTTLDGDLFFREDVSDLFIYDSNRGKWLTVNRESLICGREVAKKNTPTYMGVSTTIHSSTEGFYMYNNGTITNISIDNSISVLNTRNFEIRINNSTTNKITLPLNAGTKSNILNDTNLDFTSGDRIQVIALANGTDDLENITILIEVAWRV